MSPRALAVFVIALTGFSGATSHSAIADRNDLLAKYGNLGQRISEYYQLEKDKNWAKAWEYRTTLYRSTVPRDTYVRLMQKDTQGWELKSYVVRNVTDDGPCVLLTISFIEIPPKGYYRPHDVAQMRTEDQSRWEKIDGVWLAWETGSRARMSLNSAVVAPNQTSRGSPSSCGSRSP